MLKEKLIKICNGLEEWKAPELCDDMPHGDMPGDKIRIEESHEAKASVIFPELFFCPCALADDSAAVFSYHVCGLGCDAVCK